MLGADSQVADRENEMKKIVIAFTADGIEWSPWQVVWTDDLPVSNVTMKGDVDYPSLMALEGDDNEVLGRTFAVVFQYRLPGTAAPYEFDYVNVTVSVWIPSPQQSSRRQRCWLAVAGSTWVGVFRPFSAEYTP